MSLLEDLKDLGANIDEGLDRFMQNSALYERMLGTFIKMMNNSVIDPNFDSNNYGEVVEKAHAIKGTSGNLSLTPIYEAYTDIVDLLRAGKPEEAREVLVGVLPVQAEIIECIQKYKK